MSAAQPVSLALQARTLSLGGCRCRLQGGKRAGSAAAERHRRGRRKRERARRSTSTKRSEKRRSRRRRCEGRRRRSQRRRACRRRSDGERPGSLLDRLSGRAHHVCVLLLCDARATERAARVGSLACATLAPSAAPRTPGTVGRRRPSTRLAGRSAGPPPSCGTQHGVRRKSTPRNRARGAPGKLAVQRLHLQRELRRALRARDFRRIRTRASATSTQTHVRLSLRALHGVHAGENGSAQSTGCRGGEGGGRIR